MDRSNLTRDLYGALALRERGIALVKWEALKAGAKMTLGATACAVPLIVTIFFVNFELPMFAVAVVVSLGMGKGCYEGFRVHRRRLGEIEILGAITPLVESWRAGREISSRDRDQLHQFKELLFAQIVRYREEADAWRLKGRMDKGAALTALLFDLEDAKKLLDGGFARREQDIRPSRRGRLEVNPAPIDLGDNHKTGLED